MVSLSDAAKMLNISENDLKSLCDLKLIKHDNYMFDIKDINSYNKKRNKNDKLRYIPICDVEMLKNDKYEGNKS